MNSTKTLGMLMLLLIISVLIAACGTSTPETVIEQKPAANEAMMDKETSADETMMEEKADGTMMEEEEAAGEAMMEEEADETMMEEKAGETVMEEEAGEAMMEKEESTDETMMEKAAAAGEAMMEEESADETMMDTDETAMMGPDWFEAGLTNVNTGETFKISEFQDKVILVETIAVWCSNCLKQQQQVEALHGLLGERDDLVSVTLDIDPNENDAILKAHTDKNGFNWRYAVAPVEVAREIGQLYGGQFLNPPATPMLIIDRHGEAHPLPFGIKDAQTLADSLGPFLSES